MTKTELYLITLGSAALMSFMTNLNELNGDEWAGWSWIGWCRFWGSITVQVLIAWKALTTNFPPKYDKTVLPPQEPTPEKPKE